MAKKKTATSKSTLNQKVLRQKRQAKRKRQQYLRTGVIVIGMVLAAGYFLWPRPQAQAISQDRLLDDPVMGVPPQQR
jgi:cytochrome c-type biogenesis protein CcmH/NrfG